MKEFSDIYEASSEKVYRFLLGLSCDAELAEELTEETFYQAFLHIDRFEGRCELDTWLCQIAKNAYFKESKRRRRYTSEQDRGDFQNPYERLEDRQQAMQIHRLLHTMSEPYREVFSLHVFGELTFREIAEVFEKSESWAKMTFYRAKAKLIDELEVQE